MDDVSTLRERTRLGESRRRYRARTGETALGPSDPVMGSEAPCVAWVASSVACLQGVSTTAAATQSSAARRKPRTTASTNAPGTSRQGRRYRRTSLAAEGTALVAPLDSEPA